MKALAIPLTVAVCALAVLLPVALAIVRELHTVTRLLGAAS